MTQNQARTTALLVLSLVVLVVNRTHHLFPPVRTGPDPVDVGRRALEHVALVGAALAAALLLRGRRRGPRPPSRTRRGAWGLLGLGAAAVVSYLVLAAAGTGVGAPTDIGGGLLLLAGEALTALGILVVVLDGT